MEWSKIWRTVYCGWDGDVDLAALGEELRNNGNHAGAPSQRDDRDSASTWVCQQIQEAY